MAVAWCVSIRQVVYATPRGVFPPFRASHQATYQNRDNLPSSCSCPQANDIYKRRCSITADMNPRIPPGSSSICADCSRLRQSSSQVWSGYLRCVPGAALPLFRGFFSPGLSCTKQNESVGTNNIRNLENFPSKTTGIDLGSCLTFHKTEAQKPFSRLACPRLWGKHAKQGKMMKPTEREPVRRARRGAPALQRSRRGVESFGGQR